ncbi:VanZ family protein [Sporolactobacillus kofuensis]|uniref:VanZ family protein n=1 Tax=Sporolactobacillus kofuensis TaxID=269672 RepID=A0ABW1WGQ7_9BACL|nr:VanZ family protein [Sporolactobacillus kofuensis]MCO7175314.1 VanZ family protein [Sporolactobacillus kofuensis]
MLYRINKYLVIAFILYLFTLIFLTLFTHNYYTYGKSSNLIPFSSVRLMLRSGSSALFIKNIVGNVILFLPLGIFLPMIIRSKQRFAWQLSLGCMVSAVIELCQYFFAARIFDIDDILLNTLGTLIGWLFFMIVQTLRRKVIIFYSH